jgi:hypothetical protein
MRLRLIALRFGAATVMASFHQRIHRGISWLMHTSLFARLAAAAGGAALALGTTLVAASAHAVIPAGAYRVAIGWQFEPPSGEVTYVGQSNAIQVFVDHPSAAGGIGTPVANLNQDCAKPDFQVTVTYAGITSSPLCPVAAYDPDTGSGRQDEYDSPLTPTAVGSYTFHIFGSIHGTPIDSRVTSGPSTFDSVAQPTTSDFPLQLPALSEIAQKIDAVDGRVSAETKSATDAANRATILGAIAIAIALLGSGAALLVATRRRA